MTASPQPTESEPRASREGSPTPTPPRPESTSAATAPYPLRYTAARSESTLRRYSVPSVAIPSDVQFFGRTGSDIVRPALTLHISSTESLESREPVPLQGTLSRVLAPTKLRTRSQTVQPTPGEVSQGSSDKDESIRRKLAEIKARLETFRLRRALHEVDIAARVPLPPSPPLTPTPETTPSEEIDSPGEALQALFEPLSLRDTTPVITAITPPIMSTKTTTDVNAAGEPPNFDGKLDGQPVREWLQAFKRFCLRAKVKDDAEKAEYLDTFLVGAARDWFETLPEATKGSYTALAPALEERFKSIAAHEPTQTERGHKFNELVSKKQDLKMLQDRDAWHKHLNEILEAATAIEPTHMSELFKADAVYHAVPSSVRSQLKDAKTVLGIVAGCREISASALQEIVERDVKLAKVEAESARVAAETAKINELNRQIAEKSAQLEEEMRAMTEQLADLTSRSAPSSPPQDRRQNRRERREDQQQPSNLPRPDVSPNDADQSSASQQRSAASAPRPRDRESTPAPAATHPDPRANGNMTFPDTDEGRRAYEEAIQAYRRQHPLTQIPPINRPYPLTPGTEPAGTHECHTCGKSGHWGRCPEGNRALPHAEQMFRRNFAAAPTARPKSLTTVPSHVVYSAAPPSREEVQHKLDQLLDRIPPPSPSTAAVYTPSDDDEDVPIRLPGSHQQQSQSRISHGRASEQVEHAISQPVSTNQERAAPTQGQRVEPESAPRGAATAVPAYSVVEDGERKKILGSAEQESGVEEVAQLERAGRRRRATPVTSSEPRTPPGPPPSGTPTAERRARIRPQADVQELRRRAQEGRRALFYVKVEVARAEPRPTEGQASPGQEVAEPKVVRDLHALVDEGGTLNVISPDCVALADGDIRDSNIYVRMANGAIQKTRGTVSLNVSVMAHDDGEGADRVKTEPVTMDFEVLAGVQDLIILGRPWKVDACAVHVYEIDALYVPVKRGHGRDWIAFLSANVDMTTTKARVPRTPLAALQQLDDPPRVGDLYRDRRVPPSPTHAEAVNKLVDLSSTELYDDEVEDVEEMYAQKEPWLEVDPLEELAQHAARLRKQATVEDAPDPDAPNGRPTPKSASPAALKFESSQEVGDDSSAPYEPVRTERLPRLASRTPSGNFDLTTTHSSWESESPWFSETQPPPPSGVKAEYTPPPPSHMPPRWKHHLNDDPYRAPSGPTVVEWADPVEEEPPPSKAEQPAAPSEPDPKRHRYVVTPQGEVLPAEVDQNELFDLRRRLPLVDDDPAYVRQRERINKLFSPYRINGRPDDISEERAERVAAAIEAKFGDVGTPAQRKHLRDLIKAKHLAFAESIADLKQQRAVICDPKLKAEPPRSRLGKAGVKHQSLSPPQKEFLKAQVQALLDLGLMTPVSTDDVVWVSETKIVPKPPGEADKSVDVEQLRRQVNQQLRDLGLEHDEGMPPPDPPSANPAPPPTLKWRMVHNYAPLNRYFAESPIVPGNIELKAGKIAGKPFIFKGDGCSSFFNAPQSWRGVLLSVIYAEELAYLGYTVMPFGYSVSPMYFYQLVLLAFGDLFDRDADCWMDDFAMSAADFGQFFTWLRRFLDRCIDVGFTLGVAKCSFLHSEVTFCGQLVGVDGIRVAPQRTKAIVNWPRPRTVRELMQFRGTCSFLRSKIPGFAKLFRPLDALTANVDNYDAELTLWTREHDEAFARAKAAMVDSRTLREPCYDRPFVVQTDYSAEGLGAALLQEHFFAKDKDGEWFEVEPSELGRYAKKELRVHELPVSYASKRCTPAESRYSAHLGELVAAKFGLDKFSTFTFGQPVVLITDCSALRDILRADKLPRAHACWREELLSHNIIRVEHREGRRMGLAHGLSHRPMGDGEESDLDKLVKTTDRLCLGDLRSPTRSTRLSTEWFESTAQSSEPTPPPPREDYIVEDDSAIELLDRFRGDELEPLLKLLLQVEIPQDKATRERLRRLQRYVIVGGRLRYLWEGDFLDVVPRREGRLIAEALHRASHFGRDIIIKKLRIQRHITWPKLLADVALLVQTCHSCQQIGPTRPSAIDPIIVSSPMEVWAMDFLSLPLSHGRSKVLVIVDYFSRMLWTFPCVTQTGRDVVKSLTSLKESLGRLPPRFVSDGGSHFNCAEVFDFLDEHGCSHHIVAAYAPWVNGLVERQNGLIVATLRKMCVASELGAESTLQWLPKLPLARAEIINRPIAALGNNSPIELHYGLTHRSDDERCLRPPTYADIKLQRAFVDLRREEALATLEEAQARRTTTTTRRLNPYDFGPGDLVLKYQPHLKTTYATWSKLTAPWIGPFIVVDKRRKTYTIRRLNTEPHIVERVHGDHLKPYWPAAPVEEEEPRDLAALLGPDADEVDAADFDPIRAEE